MPNIQLIIISKSDICRNTIVNNNCVKLFLGAYRYESMQRLSGLAAIRAWMLTHMICQLTQSCCEAAVRIVYELLLNASVAACPCGRATELGCSPALNHIWRSSGGRLRSKRNFKTSQNRRNIQPSRSPVGIPLDDVLTYEGSSAHATLNVMNA